MRFDDGAWTFSPTDLATYLRCEHALTLRRKATLGELTEVPKRTSAHLELLVRRGTEHERKYVQLLIDQGKRVVEIPRPPQVSFLEARELSAAAMREGADAIVQAFLGDQTWAGFADILERAEIGPTRFGSWGYEIVDTKLARRVHPHVILQLGVYCELLDDLQGLVTERMHVILGDGSRQTIHRDALAAYIRHISARFAAGMEQRDKTRGYPVEFCGLCEWNLYCYRGWVTDDDLCLVGGIRRDQVKRLEAAGISTLTSLGQSALEIPDPGARPHNI